MFWRACECVYFFLASTSPRRPVDPLFSLPFSTMHTQRTHKKIIVHKNKKIVFFFPGVKSPFFNTVCVTVCCLPLCLLVYIPLMMFGEILEPFQKNSKRETKVCPFFFLNSQFRLATLSSIFIQICKKIGPGRAWTKKKTLENILLIGKKLTNLISFKKINWYCNV